MTKTMAVAELGISLNQAIPESVTLANEERLKKARQAIRARELEPWFHNMGWRHINPNNPLEIITYTAPRFVQKVLEKIIPPERIPGYYRALHPFNHPFPKR